MVTTNEKNIDQSLNSQNTPNISPSRAMSLTVFFGKADIGVHVAHKSRVIITLTGEPLVVFFEYF